MLWISFMHCAGWSHFSWFLFPFELYTQDNVLGGRGCIWLYHEGRNNANNATSLSDNFRMRALIIIIILYQSYQKVLDNPFHAVCFSLYSWVFVWTPTWSGTQSARLSKPLYSRSWFTSREFLDLQVFEISTYTLCHSSKSRGLSVVKWKPHRKLSRRRVWLASLYTFSVLNTTSQYLTCNPPHDLVCLLPLVVWIGVPEHRLKASSMAVGSR